MGSTWNFGSVHNQCPAGSTLALRGESYRLRDANDGLQASTDVISLGVMECFPALLDPVEDDHQAGERVGPPPPEQGI